MKFLIRESFFKDVPAEKINTIKNNLRYFYEEVTKNITNLREIPKGFWIKKLRGIDNRFEFRINNGDRIFFSFDKRDFEESITFILYSTHDRGVQKAKLAKITSTSEADFLISKEDFSETENNLLPEEIFLNYNQVISYEFLDNTSLLNNKDEYFYYYLNDEQYRALKEPTPLLVAGSAGSGKSTITIRKILNLEEYSSSLNINKIIYFTRNPLLKDNIEKQYELFRDPSHKKLIEFYTPREYYHKFLGTDTRKILRFKKFKEFLMFHFPNKKKLGLEDFSIYFEIIGVLKGLMFKGLADNWKRDLNEPLLSFDDYINIGKSYSLLSPMEKEAVYKIALKYEEWKKENNYVDLNDLATKAISLSNKYDFLITDEIQDFTETEIYFMLSLVNDQSNILFAGDIHQMINFNSFSFERVKNFYYKKNLFTSEVILKKNYRNSKAIVELANLLTELRKNYIGNLGTNDYRENFVSATGEVNVMKPDYSLLQKVQEDISYAIIVSSKEEKTLLAENHKIKMRVFSVDEVKGLEYDNVICLNLSSRNLFAWDKIFNKEVKKDQRYRKYFNLFYVGITRCRKNLIIMEEEIENNTLLEKINDFITLKEKTKDTEFKSKLTETIKISTKEEWHEEGIRLYYSENYEEAQKAFERAGTPTWILEKEIEEDISNEDYKSAMEKVNSKELTNNKTFYQNLIIDDIVSRENYLKALKYIIEIFNINYRYNEVMKVFSNNLDSYSKKELDRAIGLFVKKQEHNIIGDIYYQQNNFSLALVSYKKISNFIGIEKTRGKILENEFEKKVPNIKDKINLVNKLINRKDINFYDKNKMLPLAHALKYNDTDILDFLIFLGANAKMKVLRKYDILEYIAKENFSFSINLFDYFLKKNYTYTYTSGNNDNIISLALKNRNFNLADFILNKKIVSDDFSTLHSSPIDVCFEYGFIKYFKIFANKLANGNLREEEFAFLYILLSKRKSENPIRMRQHSLMIKILKRVANIQNNSLLTGS